jgi:hypothetical protein
MAREPSPAAKPARLVDAKGNRTIILALPINEDTGRCQPYVPVTGGSALRSRYRDTSDRPKKQDHTSRYNLNGTGKNLAHREWQPLSHPAKEGNRMRKQIFRKVSLLVLAVGLVCAGWIPFWHSSRVSAPMLADVTRLKTTLPSQFSPLSLEANALIEAKVKGQERTLSDYLPGSEDARRRWDEISSQSRGGAEVPR